MARVPAGSPPPRRPEFGLTRASGRRPDGIVAALTLLFGAVALGGCSVASEDDSLAGTPQNQCEVASDCGGGGTCRAGTCVAEQGQFSTVMFEITAPASATEFSGVRFLKTQTGLALGGDPELKLELDVVSTVKGTVAPTRGSHQKSCSLDYNGGATVPVKLTLTPSERLLGLPTQAYTTNAEKVGSEFSFELKMPAGQYDVYVEPDQDLVAKGNKSAAGPSSSDPCTVVPQLFKSVTIEAGSVALPLVSPPPSQLIVEIEWTAPGTSVPSENALESLDGWSVDVMDPATGRVLSAPAIVKPKLDKDGKPNPDCPDAKAPFCANVEYAPVVGEGTAAGKELVRLRPPDEVLAPTIVLERATLDAFSVGEGVIDQLDGVPQAVSIVGSFVETGAGKLVKGKTTLKFVAKKLGFLNSGTLFAFERSAEASDGAFGVDLLPGEYDVYIVPPPGSGLAQTVRTLEVGKQPLQQKGKTLTVEAASDLAGTALSPTGSPLNGAPVHAIPSPVDIEPLLVAAGTAPLKPQAVTAVVGSDGSFVLQSDPGTFDLSIRPESQSGFAWSVRPNVAVNSPLHELGELKLPLPVAYNGTVSVPGEVVVPGALIRAYVFMTDQGYADDPKDAQSVLQVAEARAEADGTFTLLLPAKLN